MKQHGLLLDDFSLIFPMGRGMFEEFGLMTLNVVSSGVLITPLVGERGLASALVYATLDPRNPREKEQSR